MSIRQLRNDVSPIGWRASAGERLITTSHGARTLDAIHLAVALRVPGDVRFLSFDHRQAEAAVDLGLPLIQSGEASV